MSTAVDKAEQALADYRAASVVARIRKQHAVTVMQRVKGKGFKPMTESLE